MSHIAALMRLIRVMIPILIAQLSAIGMNFLDTAMSGHAGKADLAGVSVGAGLFMPILVGTTGLLAAATPIIAQCLGRRERAGIPEVMRCGLAIGLAVTAVFGAVYYFWIDDILRVMYLAPEVEPIARYYLLAMVAALLFETPVMVLRCLTDTVLGTSVSMKCFLLALPVDALLNWLFIFGHLGVPRMGGIGAGIATLLTYLFLLALFLAIVIRSERAAGREIFRSLRIRASGLREYLAIGLPNGLAAFMEASLFGFIIIFIAPFGTEILAGHDAALNFSGIIYMLPLSSSMALTILIGIEVGAKRWGVAREYRRVGIAQSIAVAILTAALTIGFREEIAGIYTEDAEVAAVAGLFLIYAAGWQCFDAVAAPIQGILRGYKDAKVPFALMMLAYWCVCFPAGFALDRFFSHGAASYWQGLDIGVGTSALLLICRLIYIERKYRE